MNAIDEGRFVDVAGAAHWITVRGSDRRQPALLLISGPGAGFAACAPFFAEWERDFTLVQWDQPGAGFTFAKSGAEPASLSALAADGVRVAELVCAHLRIRQLAVLAFSAGTLVGLQMVRRRPDLFSAYVGSGQVVNWARQDLLSYELLVARARARADSAMLRELESIGPPPYPDAATDAIKSRYAGEPTPREAEAFADLMAAMRAALSGSPADASYRPQGLAWPDPLARSLAAYTALRRDIVSFDARALGSSYETPLFFVQGADDVFTVTSEVERYAGELEAPSVAFRTIEGAGHSAVLLRDEMRSLLVEHVRPSE
jgi:pimeloyl-ACP methyl ester carboxylesterase